MAHKLPDLRSQKKAITPDATPAKVGENRGVVEEILINNL